MISVHWAPGAAGDHGRFPVGFDSPVFPVALGLVIVGILPAFLGESHFAFLGYARNFRQTPIRRELDYLRCWEEAGGSEGAQAFRP